ncbi:MAG: hypothetical protein WA116_08625 [Anaerolineaceae bacterium]
MKHDLILFSADNDSLPGFFAAAIPRRTARGREDDSLMIFLTLLGGKTVTNEQLQQWQQRLADIFYRTGGSVTSAMRAVVDGINLTLIEKNLKQVEDTDHVSAYLSLAVIHHDTLFLAQSGSSQVITWKTDSQSFFFDPDLGGRGLGLSQAPKLRFFQDSIADGDMILFSTAFPSTWIRGGLPSQTPDAGIMWQAMQSALPLRASVAVAQVKAGEGTVIRNSFPSLSAQSEQQTQTSTEIVDKPQEEPKAAIEELLPEEKMLSSEERTPLPALHDEAAEQTEETEPLTEKTGVPEAQPAVAEPVEEQPATKPEPIPTPQLTEAVEARAKEAESRLAERAAREGEKQQKKAARKSEKEHQKKETYRKIADGAGKVNRLSAKIGRIFSKPVTTEEGTLIKKEPLSTGTKIMWAILVPLVVAVIGSSIYISKGREDQFQYLMAQARAAANNTELMTGADQQREGWNQVSYWLDQAGEYRQTDEMRALRVQAQQALDLLDNAVRLNYQVAFPGSQLPSLEISQIITVGNDVFILDDATGVVLHLNLTNKGYQVDLEFNCQPGTYDDIQVGDLVEMTAITVNNPAKAPLLALDAAGNSLYCAIGQNPSAVALIPPDGGWGEIKSITVDSGRLFVLDPLNNALWIYRGFSTQFNTVPDSYFEDESIDLSRAVEAAVGGDELFLLYQDGHTAHCLASNVTGTVECQDPYPYQDTREGAEAGSVNFESLGFGHVSYSPPPDPSVYFLAPNSAELYQFSLRLNLNRIYRSSFAEGGLPMREATAFNVASNRKIFMAFGNELFWAELP